MTGFTNILETHKAHEMGADGFLTKPFKNQDLIKIIEETLKRPEDQKNIPVETDADSRYCKVSIRMNLLRDQRLISTSTSAWHPGAF